MASKAFLEAKRKGISSPYAKDFMAFDSVNGHAVVDYDRTARMIAQDATITAGNVGIPSALVTVIDPTVTEILFSYSDYADNVASDVNIEAPARENYLFQTVIRYGDLEMATVARVRLNLASEKQKAAATILAKAHNKFYLYGVAGKKVYGMLNDPSLPATVSPGSVTIGGSTYSTWADKIDHAGGDAANLIYNDVLKLYSALAAANGGNIDTSSPIVLAVSNARAAALNAPNTYGLTAAKMLKDNFPALTIVQLPELSTGAGELLYMIVPEVFASPTAELAYSEKMRMGRLIPELSSFQQKAIGGTWGAVIKRPSLIKIMSGI